MAGTHRRFLLATAVLLACATRAQRSTDESIRVRLAPGAAFVEHHGEERALFTVTPASGGFASPLSPSSGLVTPFCTDNNVLCFAFNAVNLLVVFPVMVAELAPHGGDRLAPVLAGEQPDQVAKGELARGCELIDPVALVAAELSAELVARYGMSRVPRTAEGWEPRPGGVLHLRVETTEFSMKDRLRWRGDGTLRNPDGSALWIGACDVEGPTRTLEDLRSSCAGVRSDLVDIVRRCAVLLLGDLAVRHAAVRPRSHHE